MSELGTDCFMVVKTDPIKYGHRREKKLEIAMKIELLQEVKVQLLH